MCGLEVAAAPAVPALRHVSRARSPLGPLTTSRVLQGEKSLETSSTKAGLSRAVPAEGEGAPVLERKAGAGPEKGWRLPH